MRLALAFCAFAAPAFACEVEDWSIRPDGMGGSYVSGATTCNEGWVTLRVYEDGAFVMAEAAPADGHIFTLTLFGYEPAGEVEIRFSVEPPV